jgi:hypothetical protein
MKRALQPVQAPKPRQEIDFTVVENVCRDVAARSAILEKLAMAWSEYDPGGTNLEMDHDFWRGVEDLMRANRDDLERLYAQINGEDDKERGAR